MAVEVVVPADVFRMPFKVRYYEVDQQKVVFHSWYLAYFDEAFGEFLAARGFGYPELISSGVDVMLVHSELDWHGSLRWADEAEVLVSVVAIGQSSLTLDYAVVRADAPLCSGRSVYVTVDAAEFTRVDVPGGLRTALGAPVAMRRQRPGRR